MYVCECTLIFAPMLKWKKRKEQKKVMATKESKASMKYDEKHTEDVRIKLNKKTDKEILRKLDNVGNKQGYIKRLIKNDITKNKANRTTKK